MEIKAGQIWESARYRTRHEVLAHRDRHGSRWLMKGPAGNVYTITAHDLFMHYDLVG